MILKLTVKHYKLKDEAKERYHRYENRRNELTHQWEKDVEKSKLMGNDGEFIEMPYIEDYEFEDEDYDINERKFRLESDEIIFYKENTDGICEITIEGNLTFAVTQTVEEIDQMLGI